MTLYTYIYIYIYREREGTTLLNRDNTGNKEIFSQLVSAVTVFKGCIAFMIYIGWCLIN